MPWLPEGLRLVSLYQASGGRNATRTLVRSYSEPSRRRPPLGRSVWHEAASVSGTPDQAALGPGSLSILLDRDAFAPPVQKHKRTQDWRQAVSIVIDPWRAPDLGRVGGDVGDSGSPYAQGKHRPATGCHAPGRRPGSRPGPHLDQNVLARYAAVTRASILGLSGGLFSAAARLGQRPATLFGAKRGTRKIGIRDECRK